ncbi:MAG: M23 family metallopeptidase [FCB group bacterium]|nr:M23 family metallopeptidase [FCB group bacterium]
MAILKYIISVFLWQFLNPFGLWQSLLQNAGQVVAILRAKKTAHSGRGFSVAAPFHGTWQVARGGTDRVHSHSWNLIAQRYAYDFIYPGGRPQSGDPGSGQAAAYPAYGREILAPANGVVLRAVDHFKDNRRAGSGGVNFLSKSMLGNHVIIRHAPGVFSLLAHLKRGSCTVRAGSTVKKGQVIGLCGNSGHSTEPHLHFQLQDRSGFYFTAGLPILFSRVEVGEISKSEKTRLESVTLKTGMTVRNLTDGESFEKGEPAEVQPARGSLFLLINSVLNVLGLLVWIFFIVVLVLVPFGRSLIVWLQ